MRCAKKQMKYAPWLALVGVFLLGVGWVTWCWYRSGPDPEPPDTAIKSRMKILVTGYCNCGTCCGWRRNWWRLGRPEYDYGPKKGTPKAVGITARGTKARQGTIAADPSVLPFGTRLWVPGYGLGVVEDVGGAIKGRHIDLWFPSHHAARLWGRRELIVDILRSED